MLANAITGAIQGKDKFSGTCYNYGKPGHTKKNCRVKKKSGSQLQSPSPQGPKQPGVCPRCKKGYHWASECQSKYHKDGTPLQGNRKRGQPQAQTTTGAFVSQAAPQNYQTVPPPQNYLFNN